MSPAEKPIAEVVHTGVRWEGTGSGFESSFVVVVAAAVVAGV